jgi:hypothetical protein
MQGCPHLGRSPVYGQYSRINLPPSPIITSAPVPKPVLSEGPIAQGDIPGPPLSQHVIPDNWTEAHVSIPQKASIERILQKVGEIYVTDEELMEDIMRLLTLISDFSFCSTADRII